MIRVRVAVEKNTNNVTGALSVEGLFGEGVFWI